MNLSETKLAIEVCFLENIPVMMLGKPGIGKSSIVNQMAQEEDVELLDIRLAQWDSIDLRGVPSVEGRKTHWNTPFVFPTDPNSQGIMFYDELPHADPSTQKAAYQLIQDRRLGEYIIPDGWRIVAAGNPGSDRLTEALGNRFLHLDVEPSIRDWAVWAAKNNIDSDIIGLLMARPELLIAMPTNSDEYAFPSPRTWGFASQIHQHHRTSPVYKHLITGAVGKAGYVELMGYVNLLSKLPTLDEIAADPLVHDFKKSPSKSAAICLMIVSGATATNIDALMKYVCTIQTEFQVLTVTLLNESNNKLMSSSSITQWCIAHPDIF